MRISLLIVLVLLSGACSEMFLGDDIKSTPFENFDHLWKVLDSKYSFFEYKNVDWNDVYNKYRPKINDETTDIELFDVLFSMLAELKDAHVNLVAPFNTSHYDAVFTRSPENFNNRLIQDHYLKYNYLITGPFKHQVISAGEIGYVRFASFSTGVSKSDIEFIINRYRNKKGIIIDVRSNGGGYVSNVFTLTGAFADQKRHVYTSYIKNGPEHDNFSKPHKVFIGPSLKEPFINPVCILTNRSCYSATSFFVLAMKAFPNVTVVGDTTGGGLGAPTGGELPNGWSFRYSSSKTLSPDGKNYEDGVPPDVLKNLRSSDISKGLDTIIEAAVALINAKNR